MRALAIEMAPPPPSVARNLRMSAGALATVISVCFEEPGDGTPTALTVVVLRPDTFRIAIEWPGSPTDAPKSLAQSLEDMEA